MKKIYLIILGFLLSINAYASLGDGLCCCFKGLTVYLGLFSAVSARLSAGVVNDEALKRAPTIRELSQSSNTHSGSSTMRITGIERLCTIRECSSGRCHDITGPTPTTTEWQNGERKEWTIRGNCEMVFKVNGEDVVYPHKSISSNYLGETSSMRVRNKSSHEDL